MKWYTTSDVASLLGLAPQQVRAFARRGFLHPERGPHNEYRFSFQDLVLLRTAAALRAQDIPARRIREALERLRDVLPEGRPLSELRIAAEGDRIVVSDGSAAWNPLSGQYHLDFSVAELGEKVAPLAGRAERAARAAGPQLGAQHWYELGLDLEAYAPAEARRAYERALELEPGHADAHVNLGRLLHDAGDPAAAELHYRDALEAGPNATAAFDLAIALEDQGRLQEAGRAYRRAIAQDPDFI
ncbi:MAG TPA: tetratricopeptide repeat protein, partial [Longimicrobiales bacterium]|nr:tetratricopeptide repeat protein [Longimicrobiales bacterium]